MYEEYSWAIIFEAGSTLLTHRVNTAKIRLDSIHCVKNLAFLLLKDRSFFKISPIIISARGKGSNNISELGGNCMDDLFSCPKGPSEQEGAIARRVVHW